MSQDDERLSGEVEADETYYGAKKKRGTPRGRPGPDKTSSFRSRPIFVPFFAR
jgi:hypothetical protein